MIPANKLSADERPSSCPPDAVLRSSFRARPPILERIINCRFLSNEEKGVYMAICHHVGRRGFADLTQRQISDDLGLSRKDVRNAILKLRKTGVIRVDSVQGRHSSIYHPVKH